MEVAMVISSGVMEGAQAREVGRGNGVEGICEGRSVTGLMKEEV